MENPQFKMTLFQHALNPIICIGMSDGNFTEGELYDLKASTAQLSGWFQITPEQARKECEALYDYLTQEVAIGGLKSIYVKVPISCALVHKNLQSDEARNYIVSFLEDQALADGKLNDEEKKMITLYSTIIHHGGKAAGIHL